MGITLVAYSSLSPKKLNAVWKKYKDGFVLEYCGKEYIFYNDISNVYARQNWTILHELGHIVLDHTGCNHEREEAEANFFAKYAIAPPVLIHRIGAKTALDIYEQFDISLEAANYAFIYYKRWEKKHRQGFELTDYEVKLLELFKFSA